jgi:pimeloyl-ACP methyl ester carboxylesterase
LWFGPRESPLFGILHAPKGASRGAVVLCPPLGREYTNSYSTFALLAERLCDLGFAALRFDYRSMGDSFDRLASGPKESGFVRDVATAVEFVRSLGAVRVGLVGMRMGANFALAHSGPEPLDALVLWDACLTGRSFLREQRVLGLLASSRVGGETLDALDLPGLELTPEMSAEISTSDLVAGDGVAAVASTARQVLLLTRRGREGDRKLVARFEVPNVEHEEVTGQPELLEVQSPDQVVPAKGLEAVAAWLDKVMARELAPMSVPVGGEVTVEVGLRGHLSPDALGAGTRAPVREHAVRLGPAGLFAIETDPDSAPEGPVCVFFSVANEHRIGPGRMWVRLSRDLAGEGFRCVRVDMNGFGDSPARDGETQPVHSTFAIDDVLDTARAVSPEDPSDVVLFGLCSSGYQILEAALSLTPRGVCALNPALVFEPPEMASAGRMDPRRRFCLPESGLVNAASEKQPLQWLRRHFPALMPKLRRGLRSTALRLRSAVGLLRNRPGERLGELVGAGTDVLLICGPQEIRPLLETGLSTDRPSRRSDRLQVEVLPTLQHSLLSTTDRDKVTGVIIDHVLAEFHRQPQATGPDSAERAGNGAAGRAWRG